MYEREDMSVAKTLKSSAVLMLKENTALRTKKARQERLSSRTNRVSAAEPDLSKPMKTGTSNAAHVELLCIVMFPARLGTGQNIAKYACLR